MSSGRSRVLIVVFDGVQSLDVTGPLEVFAGAGPQHYEVRTASIGGRPVRTSSGLTITPDTEISDRSDSPPTADLIVIPGGTGTKHTDLHRPIIAWLKNQADQTTQAQQATQAGPTHQAGQAKAATRFMSVCTGAFLLAEAGVLNGRRATTHWNHCRSLARRYPAVTVEQDPIYVRDGNVATSAGVTAGIDLALALVEEDHGRDLALTIARHLVMFLRRPGGQRQFSTQLQAQLAARDPLREVQQYAAEHPEADLSVAALARKANLSPRQFSRAFTQEVGTPPGRYVDRVRLEAARQRLEEGRTGIEQIARQCGYHTPEAMRRAFVRDLGVPPADYRERC